MHPVSGTFELRWRWHRDDARPELRREELTGDARTSDLIEEKKRETANRN
jgi:hypothetical protein